MQPSSSSPKHIRSNVRVPTNINVANANNLPPNQFGFSAERTERRKCRVEKKLQEMQQTDVPDREREATRDDDYFDILDFAENNFNSHERTPEGTYVH